MKRVKVSGRQLKRLNVTRSNMRLRPRPAGAVNIGHFGMVYDMVGRTNKRKDAKRKALKAGYRVSKKGNVYYENRKNRSDKGKTL